MEYMKRSCNFRVKAERKKKITRLMTKSFLSKSIEPNVYTTRSSLSAIHIYIHISIRKPIQETV